MGTSSTGDLINLKPWGTLEGIRPGKIFHRLKDLEKSDEEIFEYLQKKYQVSREKITLLLQVCSQERLCFRSEQAQEEDWGMYIGIPFCPTKCVYCSFPSHPMAQVHELLEPFYQQVLQEILITLENFPELRDKISCLYLGGGTPACLTPHQIETLLITMRNEFPHLEEITFEGGRPEMMTREVLQAVKDRVHRICINPQTMSDATLKRVHRKHTEADVYKAVALAREMNFPWINMDFIAGLPGENHEDFQNSLTKAISLRPENITIHALAIKRASELKQDPQFMDSLNHQQTAEMISQSHILLEAAGYIPYYLYRQRDILAGAENIGYTLPGFASRYNTLMIAERMNIIGFGVGAASKFLFPKAVKNRIQRIGNPKDLFVYLKRGSAEVAERKFESLKTLLRGEGNVD